jgi:hypothetical protein
MKVLDMTATAISHGLMLRSDWVSKGICIAQFQTVCRDSEMNPILELHRQALFQFQESSCGFWRSATNSLIDGQQRKTQLLQQIGCSEMLASHEGCLRFGADTGESLWGVGRVLVGQVAHI